MQLTTEQLAAIVKSRRKNKTIVSIQSEGERVPIFAIPGLSFYEKLADNLGKDQPFYGFEPSHHAHTQDKANQYIQELLEVQPEGKYILAAFCAHYRVVFYMANRLLEMNKEVSAVILFEAYGPSALNKKTFMYLRRSLYSNLAGLVKTDVSAIRRKMRKLKTRVSSKTTDTSINHIYLPTDPISTYNGKVVLIKSSRPLEHATKDRMMGWQGILTGDLEFHTIKGSHMGMFKQATQVKRLGNRLMKILDRLQ